MICVSGGTEYTGDSKSPARKGLRVRLPLDAPNIIKSKEVRIEKKSYLAC